MGSCLAEPGGMSAVPTSRRYFLTSERKARSQRCEPAAKARDAHAECRGDLRRTERNALVANDRVRHCGRDDARLHFVGWNARRYGFDGHRLRSVALRFVERKTGHPAMENLAHLALGFFAA